MTAVGILTADDIRWDSLILLSENDPQVIVKFVEEKVFIDHKLIPVQYECQSNDTFACFIRQRFDLEQPLNVDQKIAAYLAWLLYIGDIRIRRRMIFFVFLGLTDIMLAAMFENEIFGTIEIRHHLSGFDGIVQVGETLEKLLDICNVNIEQRELKKVKMM